MTIEEISESAINAALSEKWYVRKKNIKVEKWGEYPYIYLYIRSVHKFSGKSYIVEGNKNATKMQPRFRLEGEGDLNVAYSFVLIEDKAMIDRLNSFLALELLLQ
jgi:hypothetical protein